MDLSGKDTIVCVKKDFFEFVKFSLLPLNNGGGENIWMVKSDKENLIFLVKITQKKWRVNDDFCYKCKVTQSMRI